MKAAIDFVMGLLGPWFFLWFGFKQLLGTVRSLIGEGKISTLFSPSAFLDVFFGNFWAEMAPQFREDFAPSVIPMIEGRMKNGVAMDKPVYDPVHGVVIEVGAGSGNWVNEYARIGNVNGSSAGGAREGLRKRTGDVGSSSGGITKIYGVEPQEQSVATLRERVQELGMEDVYEVLPVGLEDIAKVASIEPASVDSVVTICCMCSVPEPEKNIKILYDLLKPGGTWYVLEHVGCYRAGPIISLYQRK